MAAEEAARLAERPAHVVASVAQQAGLAALIAYDASAAAADNVSRMQAELEAIATGLVAEADRDDADGRYRRGDAVGFVDDELVAWGDPAETLRAVLARLGQGAEILTVIEGGEAPLPAAELELDVDGRRARGHGRGPAHLLVAPRGAMSDEVVLWHIPISHYNEKARWALAYKGVDHERRAPPAGAHMLVSLALTRGKAKTFPVMRMDGRIYGDSTDIIAALEERYPEPPLYPADAADRARALELEDFFDEELGPHIRLFGYNELLREPERFQAVAATMAPAPMRRFAGPVAGAFVKVRFRVSDPQRAELARRKVLEALDRLDQELGDGEYLVGDAFSVADLTAAALFYPLVAPPEGPKVEITPERMDAFRDPLRERRGYRWVEEMFARHRQPATVAA